MSERGERHCVLCARIIGKDEDLVIIRVQQPAHRRCYEEALTESNDEEEEKESE